MGQDLGDGDRASRNRHHHVLQAGLDALGDLDFAFAREQLDRAHFAHVHAHRVGGAAELGVHRGQGRFGLFLGFFLAGGRRGIVVEQQRLGIRRLFVNSDADVVQRGDQRVDRFRIDHVVRQVIVDFRVGQVAARLAELDQRLELLAADLEFLLGALLGRGELLEQRLFLGLAVLGLLLFGLGRSGGCGGRWRVVFVKLFSHVFWGAVVLLHLGLGLAATLLGLRLDGRGSGTLGCNGCGSRGTGLGRHGGSASLGGSVPGAGRRCRTLALDFGILLFRHGDTLAFHGCRSGMMLAARIGALAALACRSRGLCLFGCAIPGGSGPCRCSCTVRGLCWRRPGCCRPDCRGRSLRRRCFHGRLAAP
ncbi:hypothetical protein D3C72_1160700 [compost metagenome]